MLALFSLIPFKDWVYSGVIVALIAFGVYERNHLIDEGEQRETAAVQAASEKAEAAAEAKIVNLNVQHAAEVASVKGALNVQLQTVSAQHDADAQRLREYDAYRAAHPAMASAQARSGTANAGAAGGVGDDDRLSSLEQVALGLATAGARVNAALTACMADRDGLDGK